MDDRFFSPRYVAVLIVVSVLGIFVGNIIWQNYAVISVPQLQEYKAQNQTQVKLLEEIIELNEARVRIYANMIASLQYGAKEPYMVTAAITTDNEAVLNLKTVKDDMPLRITLSAKHRDYLLAQKIQPGDTVQVRLTQDNEKPQNEGLEWGDYVRIARTK